MQQNVMTDADYLTLLLKSMKGNDYSLSPIDTGILEFFDPVDPRNTTGEYSSFEVGEEDSTDIYIGTLLTANFGNTYGCFNAWINNGEEDELISPEEYQLDAGGIDMEKPLPKLENIIFSHFVLDEIRMGQVQFIGFKATLSE